MQEAEEQVEEVEPSVKPAPTFEDRVKRYRAEIRKARQHNVPEQAIRDDFVAIAQSYAERCEDRGMSREVAQRCMGIALAMLESLLSESGDGEPALVQGFFDGALTSWAELKPEF